MSMAVDAGAREPDLDELDLDSTAAAHAKAHRGMDAFQLAFELTLPASSRVDAGAVRASLMKHIEEDGMSTSFNLNFIVALHLASRRDSGCSIEFDRLFLTALRCRYGSPIREPVQISGLARRYSTRFAPQVSVRAPRDARRRSQLLAVREPISPEFPQLSPLARPVRNPLLLIAVLYCTAGQRTARS